MSPEELEAWEVRLRSWELDLAGRGRTVEMDHGLALPAAPVRGVLLHLLEDRRVGGMDANELARGLGLDRQLQSGAEVVGPGTTPGQRVAQVHEEAEARDPHRRQLAVAATRAAAWVPNRRRW